jgi:hypothetical protein
MRTTWGVFTLSVILAGSPHVTGLADQPQLVTFTTIDAPNAVTTFAADINAHGDRGCLGRYVRHTPRVPAPPWGVQHD